MGITGSKSKPYKIHGKKSYKVDGSQTAILYNVCEQQTTTPKASQGSTANSTHHHVQKATSSSSLSSTSSSELLTSNGTAESSGNMKSILSNKNSPTVKPLRSVTLVLDNLERDESLSARGKRRKKEKDNDPIGEDCIDIKVLSRRASLPSIVSFEGSSASSDKKITGNFIYMGTTTTDAPFSPTDSTKTAPTLSTTCWEGPSIRIIPPPEDLLESDVYPIPKKSILKEEKTRKMHEKRMNPVKTWSKADLAKLAKKTKRVKNPIAEDLMLYK